MDNSSIDDINSREELSEYRLEKAERSDNVFNNFNTIN